MTFVPDQVGNRDLDAEEKFDTDVATDSTCDDNLYVPASSSVVIPLGTSASTQPSSTIKAHASHAAQSKRKLTDITCTAEIAADSVDRICSEESVNDDDISIGEEANVKTRKKRKVVNYAAPYSVNLYADRVSTRKPKLPSKSLAKKQNLIKTSAANYDCEANQDNKKQHPSANAKRSTNNNATVFDYSEADVNSAPSLLRDTRWLAEQQTNGLAAYYKMEQPDRRRAIIEYYNRENAGAQRRKETVKYFINQRGWPKGTVYHLISAYVKRGQTENRKRTGVPPKYNKKEICDNFRERIAEAGGDLSKVSMREFGREMGINSSTLQHILHTDERLDLEAKKLKHLTEMHFEAKRSVVVAKFIEFTGDYRERRNACVRHFWKTPGFNQMFVLGACNKFLRCGSVRSQERNKLTQWTSEEMRSHDKMMTLHAVEVEYLQKLNALQDELGMTLNRDSVQKRPRPSDSDEVSVGRSASATASSDKQQHASTSAELAAAKSRVEQLELQLKATSEALEASQHQNRLLQQAAAQHIVPSCQPGPDNWSGNSLIFNARLL